MVPAATGWPLENEEDQPSHIHLPGNRDAALEERDSETQPGRVRSKEEHQGDLGAGAGMEGLPWTIFKNEMQTDIDWLLVSACSVCRWSRM